MNKLNDLTIYVAARTQAFITVAQNEEGSEVAQAAGVALLSAAIIGAMLTLRGSFSGAVTNAFNSLISSLN